MLYVTHRDIAPVAVLAEWQIHVHNTERVVIVNSMLMMRNFKNITNLKFYRGVPLSDRESETYWNSLFNLYICFIFAYIVSLWLILFCNRKKKKRKNVTLLYGPDWERVNNFHSAWLSCISFNFFLIITFWSYHSCCYLPSSVFRQCEEYRAFVERWKRRTAAHGFPKPKVATTSFMDVVDDATKSLLTRPTE